MQRFLNPIIQARNNGRIMAGFLPELESIIQARNNGRSMNHGRILVRT